MDKKLSKEYFQLFGKRPFGGWSDEELQKRINEKKPEKSAESAELADGWTEEDEKNSRFPTATLKLYQKDTNSPKGLVVDFKHLKYDYDENTRKYDKDMYELTVLYDDKNVEKVVIPLVDFSHINDIERVEIIETEEKRMSKVYGKIRRPSKNREGYTMSDYPGSGLIEKHPSEGWVDEKVTMVDTTCKIRRPNGDILTIKNEKLNS